MCSEFGTNRPKSGPKSGFCYFLEFGSSVFLETAYNNDSLQQCLTLSKGKTYDKKFGAKVWTKQAKIGPKVRFVAVFSSLVH